MCLIDFVKVTNPPKSEIGYKWLSKKPNGVLTPPYFWHDGKRGYCVNTQQRARSGPGFHYFRDMQVALKWREYSLYGVTFPDVALFKCRFSSILLEGKDNESPARTAKYMTILEEVK